MGADAADILVVGAGPAGATLARRLAAAGRDVWLIEREHLPRFKPCGGGLSARTLQRLDVDLGELPRTRITRVALAGAWTGRRLIDLEETATSLVVDRPAFDAHLARAAVAAGARLREGCRLRAAHHEGGRWHVRTSQGAIRADVLCACDGVFSPTARALGWSAPQRGFCVIGRVPLRSGAPDVSRATALFHLAFLRAGYAWCFPRPDGFSVGVGGAGARDPRLPGRLQAFVNREPWLAGAAVGRLHGAMVPAFEAPRSSYAREQAYLVGDAAGLADPLTGEGIYYALESARLAADAILDGGPPAYEAHLRQGLLAELVCARDWARAYRRLPCLVRGTLMSLPSFGRVAQRFVRILSGQATYPTRRWQG